MDCDVVVVGGGIAGMESALTLGDMGLRVVLIEKEPSIGGKMILLSKVFPTLDCASCISTPKMAAAWHHPNVEVLTSSEVVDVAREPDDRLRIRIRRNPTFVDASACTGCGECERVCTVAVPDRFNFDLVAGRAIGIPFPQAVPKKAVIERVGTSPCSARCPAGVQAHGYVSLVRAGKYDEAFRLHMEDAPLPGSLSRACYAPCEEACTREEVDGHVGIRAIKRFMVDHYYAAHPEPEYGPPAERGGKRVAVVGSGPAGLSAAYFLARQGWDVTIFEGAPQPGGMLRYGIPAYRLPPSLLDRDIRNVTALGVEIRCGTPVTSALELRRQGYDAVFLALGTRLPTPLDVPGREREGVVDALPFLEACAAGEGDLGGRNVAVIGGGNVAIDAARMALRAGAAEVRILYRRSRAEMPAHTWEVEAALEEGVELVELCAPVGFLGNGRLEAVQIQRNRLGPPDAQGRRRPEAVRGALKRYPTDVAILAIGLRADTSPFADELACAGDGTVEVDPETLVTSAPGIWAGGDVVTGPSMIIEAIAQGKRAAFHIDRALRGVTEPEVFDTRLPRVEPIEVIDRGELEPRETVPLRELGAAERRRSLAEIEATPTEEEARAAAARCIDCGVCSGCHECVSACPADAIRLDMRPEELTLDAGAAVLATGFKLFDAARKPALGYGRLPNVITAMQMDRLLSPTRPYNAVLRPSDGKAPSNIAYVLCTGSRDCTVDSRLCSRVCCMYSIKQAQLIMGALPLADVTIYYTDIRAFGKGYEEFYRQAEGMGVRFTKGRVSNVEAAGDGDLSVRYEDILGATGATTAQHDLVVLSVGLSANPEAFVALPGLQPDADGFARELDSELEPGRTAIPGVFVAGTVAEIRDIPDTVVHAGAAAVQAAAYLKSQEARP